MIRRAFSLLVLSALFAMPVAAAEWGDLTVTFKYDGSAPTPDKLVITKDVEFCGKFGLVDESLVVNSANGGVQNVIAYIYVARGKKQPAIHESYKESDTVQVKLDNEKCRFEPRIVPLWTKNTLIVGNADQVGHNSKIDSFTNPAQNVLIPAGGKVEMNFRKEERLPTPVSCSIHPWMNGYVVIKENPYVGVSDKDGKLTIKNIPVGKWTFQFWHEKSGYVAEGKQNGKSIKWSKGRVDFQVKPGQNDLGEVKLPPSLFK